MNHLNGGKESEIGQATHVDVSLHQDVAVEAPRSPPRIADYPVISSVGPTVTHQDDAVIDRSIFTSCVVKNP